MDVGRVARITRELQDLNAQLDPRLVTADVAKDLIAEFSKVRRAADFALATLHEGELCDIPGVGPVAPQVAKRLAEDACLSGVFFDGKDLRQLKRWSRHIPVEVATALELGPPPGFDGVRCRYCGKRLRTQFDHAVAVADGGPTSLANVGPLFGSCHPVKTENERRARRRRRTRDLPARGMDRDVRGSSG